jgi:hypothetical protein
LFSEGKAPVDVVIALDIPADEVRAIYRGYWDLKGMHKLAQIYEAKYDLRTFLRLHKIVNDLGMGEQEIINTLKLANNNELPYLQEKVEYFRNRINNLELEKTKCTNDVLTLNRRIDDLTLLFNMIWEETFSFLIKELYRYILEEMFEQIRFYNNR